MTYALMGVEACAMRTTGSVVLQDAYEAHVMRRALERYATTSLDETVALDLANRVASVESALSFGMTESDGGLFALVGASS